MKKLLILSTVNGLIGALLYKMMTEYFVSENFSKIDASSELTTGTVLIFAILSSIGYIFAARKQSVDKVWIALGIEIASFIVFSGIELALKIFGLSFSFFAILTEDNPAAGILIIFESLMFIVASLVIHAVIGAIYTATASKRTNQE